MDPCDGVKNHRCVGQVLWCGAVGARFLRGGYAVSWARASFQLVVSWPWMRRGGAVRLLAGLPWSLSRSRVRLGAAAVLLVVPCRGRTAWRSGPVAPAQAHGPWTGARWPRSLREGRWARRIPPRAPLPGGRRPPLRSSAPHYAGSAQQGRPSRRPPHRLGPRRSVCSTARPRLLPPRCGHCGRGALVVGAGPWARIAPGGGSRGRKASKGLRCRCRTASHTAWRP